MLFSSKEVIVCKKTKHLLKASNKTTFRNTTFIKLHWLVDKANGYHFAKLENTNVIALEINLHLQQWSHSYGRATILSCNKKWNSQ